MMEMFGAGTACVVSPVGNIVYKNRAKGVYEDLRIPTMENSPNLMQRFFETITDIQVCFNFAIYFLISKIIELLSKPVKECIGILKHIVEGFVGRRIAPLRAVLDIPKNPSTMCFNI